MKRIADPAAHFWSLVAITPSDGDCWEWSAARDARGYGYAGFMGRSHLAHRMAWIFTRGAIPSGMLVCHSCDNPPCCNPSHLFLGSHQDNSDDAVSKGRMAHGENHGRAVLSDDVVSAIKVLREEGATLRSLADTYGVSDVQIHMIVSGKSRNSRSALAVREAAEKARCEP